MSSIPLTLHGATNSDLNFAKFSSRMDGLFFSRDLLELIHESAPKRTLMGFASQESVAHTLLQSHNDSVRQFAVPRDRLAHFGQGDFERKVREVVAKREYFGANTEKVQQEIIDFFTRTHEVPNRKDSRFFLERYSMLLSDLQYMMPMVWESRLKANWGWPLFLYQFAWVDPRVFPVAWEGVREPFHAYEWSLVFASKAEAARQSAAERALGQLLTDALVSFVLRGEPSTESLAWPPATQTDPMRHLLVDGLRPRVRESMDLRRLKFWHQLTETHREFNLIRGTFGPRTTHEEL